MPITLPTELEGKSAQEVAEYYQNQMLQERQQSAQAIAEAERKAAEAAKPKTDPPKGPDQSDYWKDPKNATKAEIATVTYTKAEVDAMTAPMRENLKQSARLVCKDAHPDFAQFEAQITAMVNNASPENQLSYSTWEAAYTFAKGKAYDAAVAAAEKKGREAGPVIETEDTNGGNVPAGEKKVQLDAKQLSIVDSLGITNEAYIEAQKNMTEGKLPLTMSNVGRK